MLLIGRKVGERIVIDDGRIVITYLGPGRSGGVTIGIEADRSISVNREEVQRRIDAGLPASRPDRDERALRLGRMLIEEVPEVAKVLSLRIDEEWLNEIE